MIGLVVAAAIRLDAWVRERDGDEVKKRDGDEVKKLKDWSQANKPPVLTEAEAKAKFKPKPVPDAATWVMRDPEGQMVAIKVVDMTDQHLFRWIRYFRQKYRGESVAGPDATDVQIDRAIQLTMTTAPAIYAEATKRGVYVPPPSLPMEPDPKVTKPGRPAQPEAPRGFRRITLGEDE